MSVTTNRYTRTASVVNRTLSGFMPSASDVILAFHTEHRHGNGHCEVRRALVDALYTLYEKAPERYKVCFSTGGAAGDPWLPLC